MLVSVLVLVPMPVSALVPVLAPQTVLVMVLLLVSVPVLVEETRAKWWSGQLPGSTTNWERPNRSPFCEW